MASQSGDAMSFSNYETRYREAINPHNRSTAPLRFSYNFAEVKMKLTYLDLLIAFAPSINSFSEVACAYLKYRIAVLAARIPS